MTRVILRRTLSWVISPWHRQWNVVEAETSVCVCLCLCVRLCKRVWEISSYWSNKSHSLTNIFVLNSSSSTSCHCWITWLCLFFTFHSWQLTVFLSIISLQFCLGHIYFKLFLEAVKCCILTHWRTEVFGVMGNWESVWWTAVQCACRILGVSTATGKV